jgi:hypothetical protein
VIVVFGCIMSNSILKSTIVFRFQYKYKGFDVYQDRIDFFGKELANQELAQPSQELIDLANSKGKK